MPGFIITALEALAIIIIAILVLRSQRSSFLNRSFFLFLIFLALWLVGGNFHELISQPGGYFITMQTRYLYCTATMATGAFFLFSLALLLGRRPRPFWVNTVTLVTFLVAFLCLTDMLIRKASFQKGVFYITNGPYFYLFTAFFVVFGVGSFLCIALKRHRSMSIDRARATYILLGFGILFLLGLLFTIILPGILGEDRTSQFTFYSVIIPVIFTAYAIYRYRLLDVRLALRRSLAYLLALALFLAPLVGAYLAIRSFWKVNPDLEIVVSLLFLALAVALAPPARNWTNKIASRLLFSELYDTVELLHRVSRVFTSTANIRAGLVKATTLICEELRLSRLVVVIPDETTQGQGNWLLGAQWSQAGVREYQKVDLSASPLYRIWDSVTVLGDLRSDLRQEQKTDLVEEMKRRGLVVCLPIKGPTGKLGVLLVGQKTKRAALNPVDLDFLQQFSERAGLFIENYLLSTYLLNQLEELKEVRRELEESDRFKTDIITVTSHEFRTPLTIINGFAHTIYDSYDHLSDEERREFISKILEACRRLNNLIGQFLTISYFQSGKVQAEAEPVQLGELFNEIRLAFSPEQSSRIEREVLPGEITILSDRNYLTMMLKNLVENAIRYSPPELPVLIRAEEMDDEVRISIQDFGKGIDPGEVESVFLPFARLEDTYKHQIGAGLGLYIVRLIAELLRTEVHIDSQPGQGTTISFNLPQSPA